MTGTVRRTYSVQTGPLRDSLSAECESKATTQMIETRATLLERVRDPSDLDAWAEFVSNYEPLITAYVRKSGITSQDAPDIVQMVLTRLVTALPRFHLDHQQGRFRTWLWQITHSVLTDSQRRDAARVRAEKNWLDHLPALTSDSSPVDWDMLYHQRILEIVLKRISETAMPTSWACFYGRILENRPAAQIAAELGLSVNAVYVNASRLLTRVREDCAEFDEPLR